MGLGAWVTLTPSNIYPLKDSYFQGNHNKESSKCRFLRVGSAACHPGLVQTPATAEATVMVVVQNATYGSILYSVTVSSLLYHTSDTSDYIPFSQRQ